jgi:hypothetical protein
MEIVLGFALADAMVGQKDESASALVLGTVGNSNWPDERKTDECLVANS